MVENLLRFGWIGNLPRFGWVAAASMIVETQRIELHFTTEPDSSEAWAFFVTVVEPDSRARAFAYLA